MKTNEPDLVERNKSPVALNTIDAEKLLATPLPPMKYYVDGILPRPDVWRRRRRQVLAGTVAVLAGCQWEAGMGAACH